MAEMSAWTYDYDREVDVLYISFGQSQPPEPSVMREISDGVLLAVGQFSRDIIGMRVIGAHALGLDALMSILLSVGERSQKRFLRFSAAASWHADRSTAVRSAQEFLKKHSKEIKDLSQPLFA